MTDISHLDGCRKLFRADEKNNDPVLWPKLGEEAAVRDVWATDTAVSRRTLEKSRSLVNGRSSSSVKGKKEALQRLVALGWLHFCPGEPLPAYGRGPE